MLPGKLQSTQKKTHIFMGFLMLWGSLLGLSPGFCQESGALRVVLSDPSGERVLQEVGLPKSKGRSASGWVLSGLLDQAMSALSVEARSQVDLVILKGDGGKQAWIPRAFITKVQMKLVPESLRGTTTYRAKVPDDGRKRSAKEVLPWETYELAGVSRVELTSYQERLGSHFLKRRTDPAALRGEKLFVQNCMACHFSALPQWRQQGQGFGESFSRLSARHGSQDWLGGLDERNSRALISYWNAWLSEPGNR
jgi:mono/diheme cytochrome c family protein